MDESDMRGRPSQTEDNQHLSVSAPGARDRSVSLASSNRTAVEESPSIGSKRGVFKRRQTRVAVVNLKRWDCFRGFFGLFGGLKEVKRDLAATVEIVDLEEPDKDPFDHNPCPFVLTVSVYLCDDSQDRQDAQCVLDTACLQGNIISVDFARRLGFTSFQTLRHREQNGARVATGDIHTVIGALHISWFHSTSAKVFRDMRFLVSETAQVDLVIGTHSIVKHRLLSPPNLMTGWAGDENKTREQLAADESKLKDELEELKKKKPAAKEYKEKKKEYNLAKWRLQLFDANDDLKKEKEKEKMNKSRKEDREAIELRIAGLKAKLEKHSPKDSKTAGKKG